MVNHTILTQVPIGSSSSAPEVFSKSEGTTPLVLLPSPFCCFKLVSIPSGYNSITQSWGKEINENKFANPGLHCFGPWSEVAYIVTKQSNTYRAPVKSCPTSDNVMVDCDLTLVFSIGQDYQSVHSFLYYLGARKFGEFLDAATQEGIRQLVRQTSHDQVYELRGGNVASQLLKELNEKFKPFGVLFSQCAITDVRFHGELTDTLQKTTEFDSKIKEEHKSHGYQVKKITFKAERDLEELRKKNERIIQDIDAAKTRALITRQQREIEADGDRKIAVTKAMEKAAVDEARAESEKSVAQLEGKKSVEAIISQAQTEADAMRIRFDQECEIRIYQSQKKIEAAKSLAEALITEATSESKIAAAMQVKRNHDLEMKRLNNLKNFAKSGKIIISGDNGDKLIQSLVSGN